MNIWEEIQIIRTVQEDDDWELLDSTQYESIDDQTVLDSEGMEQNDDEEFTSSFWN